MRIVTLIASFHGLVHAQSEGQTISIAAPSLSEEEQFSTVIPQQYKCEGCLAIATQILHAVSRHKGLFTKRGVSEDDAIEVLDSACDEKNFQSYGLSLVNGKNKLTGPGIPTENVGPSPGAGFITMSGGMWPKRLTSRCTELVSDTEEERLVQMALQLVDNEQSFANHVCKKIARDCRRGRKMGTTHNSTIPLERMNENETVRVNPKVIHSQRMSHDEF